MSYEIINLTQPLVIQEIENVLEDYPEYPYQVAFSIDEFRQKLIAHVLSHVSSCSTVIENGYKSSKTPNALFPSLSQRLHLNALIRGSILHLLRENADWVSRHIHQKNN
ncbi:MAG TPA: hypothetical protein V6D14_34415 [Coleofasciculaceae cyanobacterium]|jgi:hypothetical protein